MYEKDLLLRLTAGVFFRIANISHGAGELQLDAERRAVIVREIERWRRSKLLPEQYCDFLLNLYRDAESPEQELAGTGKRAILNSHPVHWLVGFGSFALFCYLILYFSSFHPFLQIGLFIAAVLASLGISALFRERKPLLSYILFGIGAGVLVVGGILLMQGNGLGDWKALSFYIACCGIIWVAFGLGLRVPWIHLCGWIVLLFVYAVLVNRVLQPEGWVVLQLSWLPLAILAGWVGWLLAKRSKTSGAVFFIASVIIWFAPETYAFSLTNWSVESMQWFLLVKLLLLGAAGYVLRKTWIEWVV